MESSPLLDSLQRVIAHRYKGTGGMGIRYIDDPLPSQAPDFFSSDYLSLATDDSLREIFLRKIQEAPPGHLFGSTGSRLLTGNLSEINALESALKHFMGAPSALLFSSGFSANSAFLAHVPQENDVIVYDELIHASCREGIRLSPCTSYSFSHNSVASLEEFLLGVLQKHPQVTRGTSTVFVVVESLYSMDGDFCPLQEIVELVEALVPAGHAHIVVDEAHTSGICGPNGTGYVSHLGLSDRVHTKLHAFSKAWGFHGAVLLTSPVIKDYLVNFTKSIMFSTAMPYTDVYALEACLSVVSSTRGQELRQRLNHLCRYAREQLFIALKHIPDTILAVDEPDASTAPSDRDLCSPIIPVLTPYAKRLGEYLLQRGYAVTPLPYPIVKSSRIRVTIHTGNTEEEIDSFIGALVAWAKRQERVSVRSESITRSAGAGGSYAQAKAKL
ncbi:8-amino-7-oxononanoate synthase [Boletus edulis]|nr:8-amino-7-oxononanoate synthase [Boletus edulis]